MDTIFIIINCLIALVSLVGAWATVKNYKRNKRLTKYNHTTIVFIESKKIISTLTELLWLANWRISEKGINIEKSVAENGRILRESLNQIREELGEKDVEEIDNILATEKRFNVDRYISSLISGDALNEDRKLELDHNFIACDEAFKNMQKLIKGKMDILENKLK